MDTNRRISGPTLLAIFMLVAGCGARGPVYQPVKNISASTATIYVYRPKTLYNWGGSPEIYVNGVEKLSMRAGGYGVLEVPPGTHEIKIEGSLLLDDWYPKPSSTDIAVEAGKVYYIRTRPIMDGTTGSADMIIPVGHAEIVEVPPEIAKGEISTMKLSE